MLLLDLLRALVGARWFVPLAFPATLAVDSDIVPNAAPCGSTADSPHLPQAASSVDGPSPIGLALTADWSVTSVRPLQVVAGTQ